MLVLHARVGPRVNEGIAEHSAAAKVGKEEGWRKEGREGEGRGARTAKLCSEVQHLTIGTCNHEANSEAYLYTCVE